MRITLLLTLALTGCFDTTEGRDRDGDGFETSELDGNDCDDDNVNINPDAAEVCGNGVDDNCDGLTDDAGAGSVEWYVDLDQDGFPAPEVQEGCARPAGSFTDLSNGVDCDDTDADVNPNATEVYYNGVDQDCSGDADNDADGDGFIAVVSGGDDCHDGLAEVNPGMPEVCNNGLDDDCDGGPGDCEYAGDLDAAGVETIQLGASDYVAMADWNDDGLDDAWIALSDDGSGSLYLGPFDSSIPSPSTVVSDAYDCAGHAASGEVDYNGDGVGDLSLNCNEEGIYVFYGPVEAGSFALADAAFVMTGSNLPDGRLVAVNDQNADGVDEVLVPLGDGFHLLLSPHGVDRVIADEPLVSGDVFRTGIRISVDVLDRFPAVQEDGTAVVSRLMTRESGYEWSSLAAFPDGFESVSNRSMPDVNWDITGDGIVDWLWPSTGTLPLLVRQYNADGAPSIALSALGPHPDGEVFTVTDPTMLCDFNRDGEVDLAVRTRRRTGISGFTFDGVELFYGPGLVDGAPPVPDAWISVSQSSRVRCGNSGLLVSGTSGSWLLPSLGM